MAKALGTAIMTPRGSNKGEVVDMQVIGHRGSAETAPENTLLGVKTALAAGAPWVEIDVRHVAGELFVIHDQEVDRTTNGKGSIYALSRTEILNLDAGEGEVIPTLQQVLGLLAGQASINIELKDTQSMQPTCRYVATLLSEQPEWLGKIMISTFEASIHDELAKLLPRGCLLGVLFKQLPANVAQYAIRLNAYSINLSFAQLTPDLVSQAQRADLKVFVYTVNEAEEIRYCLNLGVDAIYTDDPRKTLTLLDKSNIG